MYEGENKNMINDSYNQIKVYRANGEYACAEIVKGKNGKYVIMPHEYGTYYLKNGMYSEMGRDPIRYNWVDKNTSRGRWYNRVDEWKKVIGMPEELVQHIVDKCKPLAESPAKMQELMKEQKQHKGIIVSDHLYEAIMQVADDLFLLRDGYTFPIKSREELIHHGYILR